MAIDASSVTGKSAISNDATGKPIRPSKKRRAKGEGGLHFRADKQLWQLDIDLPRGSEGKRRRRVLYGKTRDAVKRKLADLKARRGGKIGPSNPTRLSEFMLSWLSAAKRRVRPRSYETYEWAWGWVSPLVGGVRLEKFDRSTVLTLIDELEGGGASANTINHCLRVMASVFVDALAEGVYVGLNPFTLVTKQKPKHTVERGRALSIDECRALLEAAKEDRLEGMWVLALTAGLRIGELCGLQWRDIDFAKRTVDVVRQIVYVDGKPTEADLKTTNSRRLLPLGPIAIDALQRRKRTAETEHASIWVFPTTTNPTTPMAPANARKRNFAETIKRAQISGKITPHDLRHTMSTLGDHAGVTAKTRAARLGHASSTLTESTYTHSLTGDDVAAAAAIDDVLKSDKSVGLHHSRRIRRSSCSHVYLHRTA